jgi:hypothetical protein
MKITLRQLKLLGACTSQINLFKEIFGTEIEITEDIVNKHGAKFDTDWLAKNVLPSEKYADYRAKRAPLYADYKAKCDLLYADYKAKCDLLYADYEAKLDSLCADYKAKRELLHAEYEAKRELIFWEVIK